MHEASLWDDNAFITLTFNDANLPADGSLNVRHYQLFMKRLRKQFGSNIRFFHCGEYGEKFRRPHYHACLFNHDFHDKTLWKVQNDQRLFISADLEKLWPYGFSTTGVVTFQSAAYVARYIMKKVTGDLAEEHYQRVDPETGEITQLRPEYTTMSRRPGIGHGWLKKFYQDIYPDDFVVIKGKRMKPPKYYDRLYEIAYPSDFDEIRRRRILAGKLHVDDNTPERLNVRERVKFAQIDQLPRTIDQEL